MAIATAVAVLIVPALAEADVSAVNQQRAAAGLPPVTENGGLTSLAQQHSAQMAATSSLVHTGDLGGVVSTVLPSFTGAAENVGQGPSVATVTSLFMGSPTHRGAILGNFDTAGVGVARGPDGRVWVTQLFARTGAPGPPAVMSNNVRRAAPTCRTQTRRVTRVVRGRRVTRVVRSKRCVTAKRKVARKRKAVSRKRKAARRTVRRARR